MKKWFIIMICCSLQIIQLYAENDREQQLRNKIAYIDSTIVTISPKQQTDTLLTLVEHYRMLDTLSMHIITTKDSLLQKYAPYEGVLFLLSSDTAIFVQDYSDSIQIPKSLEYHFQTIKMIISARKQIESIEQNIKNIAANYMQEALTSKPENTLYSRIAQEIEGDMDNVTDLLIQIKERDLNSLSSQQQEYFKPGLTERYNNFLIFFE